MCTSIHLIAQDFTHVLARTMDWPTLAVQPLYVPRDYAWQSPFDHHEYRTRYALIGGGSMQPGRIDVSDGVNEYGLCVQKLTFANGAKLNVQRRADRIQLAPFELSFWLLSNCRNLQDVAARLPELELMADEQSDTKYGYPELHFAISDTTGACAVLEPTASPLRLRMNPLGVVTNSPDFDEQLRRMHDYVEFTPEFLAGTVGPNVARVTTGNLSGKKVPSGSYTPGARFIRAAYLKERSDQAADETAALTLAWHLLDAVTVVKQSRHQPTYSVYRAAACANSRKYYYQSYQQAQASVLTLDDDLLAQTVPQVFATPDEFHAQTLNGGPYA
ncbi:linear amide C-N hydrolase [Lacticaseibacillus jixiensis]|uniref:linear amide C-N hydrolase n=1 Tax=Lacticaseibacillus jixiensis TaxID=3231926 RepID=UPI0036F1E4FE